MAGLPSARRAALPTFCAGCVREGHCGIASGRSILPVVGTSIRDVRPIYSRDQGIRLHGLKVHRLRLNRHLPKVDRIADHAHAHSQLLLYLGGAGFQKIAGETYEIRRGSLFFVPPRISHSFIDAGGYKPLCLALDLDLEKPPVPPAVLAHTLTLLDLKRVRQELSLLARWRTGHEEVEPREAAAVLRLIDLFFRALGVLPPDPLPAGGNLLKTVPRVLPQPDARRQPLNTLAGRIGYHPDYLNRMLKAACGLTLGEVRSVERLQTARRLLAQARPVAEVAAEAGFDDPNYFARWFRAQVGCTPTAWRVGGATRKG